MDSSKFQINKYKLKEEFYSDLNKSKRTWFSENFSSEARQFKRNIMNFSPKTLIMFFEWLEDYSDQDIAKNPFQNSKSSDQEFLDRIEQN